jgi:hypothetical protein
MHPTFKYSNFFQNPYGKLTWYPKYNLNICQPISKPASIKAMLVDDGIYVRKFTIGKY